MRTIHNACTHIAAAAAIACSVGCANTPQGQAVQRAQLADIGTTAVGIAEFGAVEMNPAAAIMLPFKLLSAYALDNYPCDQRQGLKRGMNSITWGAVANNVAIMAGSTAALPIGAVLGTAYYMSQDEDCRQDTAQLLEGYTVLSSKWTGSTVAGQLAFGPAIVGYVARCDIECTITLHAI